MSEGEHGKLPYRPNVGICLLNTDGHVWMGKAKTSGPEIVTPGREWQMPQGGIEETEDIVEAARRELWEETRATSVEFLAATTEWWSYDFPAGFDSAKHKEAGHKLNSFCGQKQKWVAFRFTGTVDEIDITASHTGEPQEFFDWDWLDAKTAFERTVSYKMAQYERVFAAFGCYIT
ncbi:MAG: RNA pyrophosphohydrolase [Pseudomonadota bacterium]